MLVDGLDVEVRVGTYEGSPVIRSVNLDLSDETPDARLGVLGVVRGWVLARPELTRDQNYLSWCLAIPAGGARSWFQPLMRAGIDVLWDTVPGFVPHPIADRRHVPRAGLSEWPEPTVEFRTQAAHRPATVLNGFATVTWWVEEFRPEARRDLDLDLDVLSLTILWSAAPALYPSRPPGVVEVVGPRVWPRHIRVSVLRTPHPGLAALTDEVLDALLPVLGRQLREPCGPHWATTIDRRPDRGRSAV